MVVPLKQTMKQGLLERATAVFHYKKNKKLHTILYLKYDNSLSPPYDSQRTKSTLMRPIFFKTYKCIKTYM